VQRKTKENSMVRKDGEDYQAYRIRRSTEQKRLAQYLRGRVVWDNYTRGTSYVRALHGKI